MAVFTIPAITRNPGIYELPTFQVSQPVSTVIISVPRANLPTGPVLDMFLRASHDNVTWESLGGINCGGGPGTARDGGQIINNEYSIDGVNIQPGDWVSGTIRLYQQITTGFTITVL